MATVSTTSYSQHVLEHICKFIKGLFLLLQRTAFVKKWASLGDIKVLQPPFLVRLINLIIFNAHVKDKLLV